jgi:tetraacyldisaccharide 4'-kinase
MRLRVPAAGSVRQWIPRWWRGETGRVGRALSVLLAPGESLFAAAVRIRNTLYDREVLTVRRASLPVISIGNLSVGGTGKTPFTAWLATRLQARGWAPAVVARGYGRDELLVHGWINPDVPVFAATRRIRGAEGAAAEGRRCVLLDDGFQHRALARDLDIVLVAAESWSGARRMLPRGPWREGTEALRRSDLVVVTRKTASLHLASEVAASIGHEVPGSRVAICSLLPTRLARLDEPSTTLSLEWLAGREVLAVSTLAEPGEFHRQLASSGARVTALSWPDHFEFRASDVAEILRKAKGRIMVMTRKEAVKLRAMLPRGLPALVLEQEVCVERELERLDEMVDRVLQGSR